MRIAICVCLSLISLALLGCPVTQSRKLEVASPDHSTRAKDRPTTEYHLLQQRDDRMIVQLPNRMVVMAQRMPTASVVSVQGWIKTGSIYEQEHVGAGLSHFLEHLVSGGTTDTRPEAESNAILGRIGAQTNAATGLDTVRYYINTSADEMTSAIDLLSDWLANASITEAEYQRERQVIQREFEMGRADPGRILWKLTQQARYGAHPARHPTIGYLDEFLSISRDEIYSFYKRMYVPNNMVFVVVGDIDPAAAVEQVAERWSHVPTGQLPELTFPVEPGITEPIERSGEADIERPRLRLAFAGTRLAAEGDYALDLLAQVLGQGELSRLTQTVRDQQGLVTSIDAYNVSFSWGAGFFGIDAVTTPDKLDQAEAAIVEQIRRIQSQGVTDDELARAKRKTIASVVYATQTANAMAARLAGDFIHTGDPDYLHKYAQAVQQITDEQLQAAARRFLDPQRMITVKLLPTTDTPAQPARPADTVDLASLDTEPVDLDNSRLVERFIELQQNQPDATTAADVGDIRMVRLDNGLRLLIQRNTTLPIVAMQWYHLGGLLADEPGREGVANAMAQMMMRGAGDMDANQLSRRLEDLGAQLSTDCGNSTFYVTSQCLADDWPVVMELLATVIQRPTFPEDQWQRMKRRLLAAIDSLDDSWYGQLRGEFREAYFGPSHPWSQETLGRRQTVEQMTVEQLHQFHADHVGAESGVLAVFGDVDAQAVIKAAREQFGQMPRQPAKPVEAKKHRPVEPRIVQSRTTKPVVGVQVGFGPGMARNNPDYAPMLVMTRVASSFPTGWLEQALRGEGPGLVYAVGAFAATGYVPGYWAAIFNTQPATAEQAVGRTLTVIERLRSEPVDQATLERARQATLVREALGSQSNSQRAAQAALDALYGVGHDGPDELIRQIRGVTAADVRRVAEQYLAHPLLVLISPEAIDLSTVNLNAEPADAAAGD